MDIITKKRADDWKAYLASDPKVWEAGKTESEAVHKLMVTLTAKTGITIRREEMRLSDDFIGGGFTEKFLAIVKEMQTQVPKSDLFSMVQAARLCTDKILGETRKQLIDAGWMTESEVNHVILKVCLQYMSTKGKVAA